MAKGRKRLIEDVGDEDIRRSGGKRSRSDGAATESNNSDTSHISALTTIFSPRSSHSVTPETETGSDSELSESSEEPSSPSSSSSDEDEDESEADRQEDVTVVRVGAKPEIQPAARLGAGLLQRLRSFMPEMEKANEQLQRERVDGTLGERSLEVDAEGQGAYIEMDLGLGVLEQRGGEREEGGAEDTDSDEQDDEMQEREKDIIGSLMGQKPGRKPVNIEEVGDDG